MVKKADILGDKMKEYEGVTRIFLNEDQPFIVRLDGKAFHTWTKGLDRPFDADMMEVMSKTAVDLLTFSNAQLTYTQSDEITLVFFKLNPMQQLYFNGNVQKIASVLAARASSYFNLLVSQYRQFHAPAFQNSDELATFDARVFNVDDLEDAAKCVYWRWKDAKKNAISMAASSYFSYNELLNKNSSDKINLLSEKGVEFDSYPEQFKYGVFSSRVNVDIGVPNGVRVLRTKIEEYSLDDLSSAYKELPDYLFSAVFQQHLDMMKYKKERKQYE